MYHDNCIPISGHISSESTYQTSCHVIIWKTNQEFAIACTCLFLLICFYMPFDWWWNIHFIYQVTTHHHAFARFGGKTSYPFVNRGPELFIHDTESPRTTYSFNKPFGRVSIPPKLLYFKILQISKARVCPLVFSNFADIPIDVRAKLKAWPVICYIFNSLSWLEIDNSFKLSISWTPRTYVKRVCFNAMID